MARVSRTIAVAAAPSGLLELIADYSRRGSFLPDGWRFLGCLTPQTSGLGAQMEIEARIGPAPTRHVVELQAVDAERLLEAPPGAYNFRTTWTVLPGGSGSSVSCEIEFEYGGLVGEFLAGRRLDRALRQMLERLAELAEDS